MYYLYILTQSAPETAAGFAAHLTQKFVHVQGEGAGNRGAEASSETRGQRVGEAAA